MDHNSHPGRFARSLCFFLFALFAVGCGGGNNKVVDSLFDTGSVVLESISVTPHESTLPAGISRQFTATGRFSNGVQQDLTGSVNWVSSSTAVATISDTGVATGVSVGVSTISASLDGKVGLAEFTVTPATISSITVMPDMPRLADGTSRQLTAVITLSDNSTQDVTTSVRWTSDNPSVATIDDGGLARSVEPGQTTIIASHGAVSGETVLTVTPATLASLEIQPNDALSSPGTSRTYRALGTFTDGTVQEVTEQVSWGSNDEQVIVSSQGRASISASAPVGSVISITASLTGISASSTLTLARFAYVANRSGDSVSMYAVASNGILSALSPPTVDTGMGSSPFSITIAPNGRDLYVTTSGIGTVTQYRIENSGQLTFVRDYAFKLGSLAFRPDGNFAYGPDPSTLQIRMFSVDNGGTLLPTSPATIPSTGLSPTYVAVGVSDDIVYVTNFQGDSVSMYAIQADGLLSALTPATVPAGDTTRSIALTPDGKYAYVTNQSDHTLSMYKIESDGSLTPLSPQSQTVGFTPLYLVIDPSGSHLYVSNNFDGTISQFQIGSDGLLSPLTPATITDPGGQGVFDITLGATGNYLYATNKASVSMYGVNANGTLFLLAPSTVATAVSSAEIVVTP